MLVFRAVLAAVMVVLGATIIVQMLAAGTSDFKILPGIVLGVAMLLLGVHRLRLIARVWGAR